MINRNSAKPAYSLVETLLTIVIIQAISAIVVVNVADVQPSENLTRAAQQTIGALRYARMLAMSSGKAAGVEFDTGNQTLRVYQGGSAETVSSSMMSGGKYVVDFGAQPELAGVTISNVTVSGDSCTPYRVTFGVLGGANNRGTVTLKFCSQTRTVTIPLGGDAPLGGADGEGR